MHARLQINLLWLLKLRWAAAFGQSFTILFVAWGLGIELPWMPLMAIIAAEIATNAGLRSWYLRQDWTAHRQYPERLERLSAAIMLLDVVLLSGLLYFTGGPLNPFSIFYVINISLAAVILKPRLTWIVAGVALACYTVLFFAHVPLLPLEPYYESSETADLGRSASLHLLLAGLWVAFASAVTFIVYFITRLTAELAQREAELSAEHRKRAESQKVHALATLAAGAAHELANPLATIAVAAHELELSLAEALPGDPSIEDVRLIRQEVDRCRGILDLMAAEVGQDAGERHQRIAASDLVAATLHNWVEAERVDVTIDEAVGELTLQVPRHAVSQSLRAIVQNAFDASTPQDRVALRVRRQDEFVEFVIHDNGKGMPPEVVALATDPFFTTKEAGKGMGLGLFLVRTVVERLGGSLLIDSVPDRGTDITVRLPLAPQMQA